MFRGKLRICIGVLVILFVMALLFWEYYSLAWQSPASSTTDFVRLELLTQISSAVQEYRLTIGVWPGNLASLQDGDIKESLRQLPVSGPNRVVYLQPQNSTDPMLISYGHRESLRGWDLNFDPACWIIYANGKKRLVREKDLRIQ